MPGTLRRKPKGQKLPKFAGKRKGWVKTNNYMTAKADMLLLALNFLIFFDILFQELHRSC
jgi:hypothetical protein